MVGPQPDPVPGAERLAARIAANVAHFAAGQQLDGLIDANAGD